MDYFNYNSSEFDLNFIFLAVVYRRSYHLYLLALFYLPVTQLHTSHWKIFPFSGEFKKLEI